MDLSQGQEILLFAVTIFLGIGLHEYAHCKVAELMGDPTPREMGRVTLNLFKHFDLLGAVMIIVTAVAGIGIGWGKPAPMNPNRMKNPRWGFFAAVLAGPVCNLIQAVIYAIILRILIVTGTATHSLFLTSISLVGVQVNLRLALFNLIPLGPLDGHWLIGLLMPKQAMNKWFRFNMQYGGMILIVLIIMSQSMGRSGIPSIFSLLLGPPVDFLSRLLTGIDLS